MKTKIIYISGSEVFDMADIRAAFDEVRAALSLGTDTVLFGVPVDNDDALTPGTPIETVVEPAVDVPEPIVQIDEPVVEPEEIEAPVEKPKKVARRARAKVVPIAPIEPETETEPEPVVEQPVDEKPSIPILSVLGAKSESEIEPEPIEPEPIDVAPVDIKLVDNKPETPIVEQAADTQHVSISDMIADDTAPVENHEKTLEELLESMTPLGEDEKIPTQPVATIGPEPEPDQVKNSDTETDVTLELLAAEFAESADKIVAPAKPETRGKIGKLKNILPFKKAKRDDSGIMGDLFGWAGVANDEDFTIPGFFANATNK